MPVARVVGVPFVLAELANSDGTTFTVTVTVTDGAGRFTVSADNTGTGRCRVIDQTSNTTTEVTTRTTTVTLPGTRRWTTSRLSVCSV